MSGSSCHFCANPNPAGAKFCNRCGEPLDLKPCPHCDAMSHVAVDRCHQCGSLFKPEVRDREVAEIAVGASVAEAASAPSLPRAGRLSASSEPRQPTRSFDSPAPFERIPVALSDRMEAGTERVAGDPAGDPLPLASLAEGDPDPHAGVDDVDWIDPRRRRAARQELRVRRRARAGRAALAATGLCALVLAGLYAYDAGFVTRMPDWFLAAERQVGVSSADALASIRREIAGETRAKAPPSPVVRAPAVTPEPGATSGPAAPATAGTAATTATPRSATPATGEAESAPPPSVAPNAASAPATTAAPAAPKPSAAAPTSTPGGRVAASRTHKEASQRTPREPSARASRTDPAQRPLDKDALATQRLIQRDLAGFLPPDASSTPPPR